ncbi:MAG: PAS domain S-box protein [Pseudomonadota bacterium]
MPVGVGLVRFGRFLAGVAGLLARRFGGARPLRPGELRLLEQQQRADLLVRATQAGLLEWDAAANVTTYSARFKEMLGHAPDADASRWQFFDLIHPEDRERIRASFLAQLRDRSVKSGVREWHDPADYRLRRADGTYIWIHAEAVSVTGGDGRTLRYVCSFIDISERKRQEKALRRSEARYDAAMRAINEGVYDWNVLAGTIFYSDSVYRALGVPESMKTPQDWVARVHPEDLARYNAAIVAHFKGETERFECDYRFRSGDGSWRWARQHGIAMRDERGRAVRMVGATGDITALKLAELELHDQMALTRQLIEDNPSAMYLKDTQGRYVTVNDAWLKMVGTTRERAIGRNVRELFPEQESEKYHAEDMRLLAQGEGMSEVESLRTGPDGKPQWVIIRKSVLRRADGTVIGLIGANTDITRLKGYEEALATEQRRLDLVVRAARVGVVDWNGHTRATYYSSIFREILGYPPDADTSGWPDYFKVLIHPEDRDRITRRWRAFILGKSEEGRGDYYAPEEYRLLRADGGYAWVQVSGIAVRDAKGFVTRWIAAVTDITGRRAQEEALRNQMALTETIVTQAPNAIFAKDRAGRFTLANRGWSEMSGVPAGEALGRTVHDIYPAALAQRFAEEDEKLLAQGASAAPIEALHQGPRPGQYRIVRKAVLSRDGEVLGLVCSSTDISELKRMEQALARERERLALLLRASKAGFVDWDTVSDAQAYSERLKEMLGYAPDADTSAWPSILERLHPEDRERTQAAFRDMLRSGAETGERVHGPLECRLRKADGSYLWVRCEGLAQIGADGRTERFLVSFIDITQLRELNRALEESVRLREEVDRMSRHDLKTPISSIVGIPRLLRDSGRLSGEDAELLAMVEQAGYRLLGMVNLSLDLFRMEQGTYPFSPAAVDLLEVAGNVVRDLRPQADSLRVALNMEGPRVHARAETLLCYSMLANLVKNALEASPSGGVVRIGLEKSAETAFVRVHNEGVVPEAVRARFFDKYSSAGKRGGTGLGTYSARLMARTQQGEIEMQTSEAAGTTLTVRLHAAAAPAPREAGAAFAAEPAPAAEPPRSLAVLVVDDDEYTRLVVRRFLPAGTRSTTAANGREALDAAIADPPDAIVMDLDMPVLGGIEAAIRIREWEREAGRARCALVAMSSHDDAATRKRCLEAGFDAYLDKPVSPEALHRALAEFARAPAARDPVRVDRELEAALPGFLDSRRALATELAAALEAGEAERARAIAHKLAGSLALYGFRWAAAQGRMIERRARTRALEGLTEEVEALRRHLAAVEVRLGGN